MADLKPCPFCGGEAMMCTIGDGDGYRVACKRILGCGAKFEWFDTEEEAIEAWNTRKPEETVVAELEKLKGIGGGCAGVPCNKCKYIESCIEGEEAYKVALDKAIEIARGKE